MPTLWWRPALRSNASLASTQVVGQSANARDAETVSATRTAIVDTARRRMGSPRNEAAPTCDRWTDDLLPRTSPPAAPAEAARSSETYVVRGVYRARVTAVGSNLTTTVHPENDREASWPVLGLPPRARSRPPRPLGFPAIDVWLRRAWRLTARLPSVVESSFAYESINQDPYNGPLVGGTPVVLLTEMTARGQRLRADRRRIGRRRVLLLTTVAVSSCALAACADKPPPAEVTPFAFPAVGAGQKDTAQFGARSGPTVP